MDETAEYACRIAAEMREDGEITVRVEGDFANVILCIGGLIRSASDVAELSAEKLAEYAVLCANEQTMNWKEREDV